jgi:TonB family protein
VVAAAGFGSTAVQNAPAHRVEAGAAETPVEVIWKPKPLYTEEARAKKLEGNVTLEVVFRATGEVQVIRVVRGLGSGLDESARSAAEQIRFHPGKKDGVPVDRTGLVQITFELS